MTDWICGKCYTRNNIDDVCSKCKMTFNESIVYTYPNPPEMTNPDIKE